MTDSEKLRLLADWFDLQDKRGVFGENPEPEVQNDLRRIADMLENENIQTKNPKG